MKLTKMAMVLVMIIFWHLFGGSVGAISPSPTVAVKAEIGSKEDKSPIFVAITIGLLLLIVLLQDTGKEEKGEEEDRI